MISLNASLNPDLNLISSLNVNLPMPISMICLKCYLCLTDNKYMTGKCSKLC